eukprot:ANDGO_08592.mRNA.1 Transcription initiation factor IIB
MMDARCLVCNGMDVVEDFKQGDLICRNCGAVLQERIVSEDAEYRSFENDAKSQEKIRVSSIGHRDKLLDNGGYVTQIVGGKEGFGAGLAKIHRSVMSSAFDQFQASVFQQIDAIGLTERLPRPILDAATTVFNHFAKANPEVTKKDRREDKFKAYAAVALYIACKNNGARRTFPEIAGVSGVPEDVLKHLFKEMHQFGARNGASASSPGPLIARLCARLGRPYSTRPARYFAEYVERTALSSRKPSTWAATGVYFALQLSADPTDRAIPIETVSQVCQVAGTTILNVMQKDFFSSFPAMQASFSKEDFPHYSIRPDALQFVSGPPSKNL